MKSSLGTKRVMGCVVIGLCLAVGMVVRTVHSAFTHVPHIEIVCDSQLTPLIAQKLSTWCKEHPDVIKNPQKLVDEFCWIKSCAVRYTNIGSATVCIVPHAPLAVLNERTMLTLNGAVTESAYYQDMPAACFKVPERLFTDHAQRKALVAAAQNMKSSLFEQYVFVWQDATSCMVTQKSNGNVVVADYLTVSDAKKIELGMSLTHSKCIADIRFNEQVIVAKKRGGDEIISRC